MGGGCSIPDGLLNRKKMTGRKQSEMKSKNDYINENVPYLFSNNLFMMARKKSSRFITNKFTSNLKIFALLLMMRNITLVVKFDEKYVHPPTIHVPS